MVQFEDRLWQVKDFNANTTATTKIIKQRGTASTPVVKKDTYTHTHTILNKAEKEEKLKNKISKKQTARWQI